MLGFKPSAGFRRCRTVPHGRQLTMFLPEISIKRPVLATVMSLLIILVGVISFLRLTLREYPKIDTPVVSVRTGH
jgi:hypothetical protein